MTVRERGRRLRRTVTATLSLLGIIVASSIGLHTWADIESTATDAAAAPTSMSNTGSTLIVNDAEARAFEATAHETAAVATIANGTPGVSHSTSTSYDATSSGS